MRIIHTADWHLGQTLHGRSRGYEHDQFLAWLLDQVERFQVEALIVAGDVFDHSAPKADALARLFGFLAEARRRFPELALVVVGGNHDAPARLDAPRALYEPLRIHVTGGLPIHQHRWDLSRLLIPLGEELTLLAVPFLRPKDLPATKREAAERAGLDVSELQEASEFGRLDLIEAHRAVYEALTQAALHKDPTRGLIATGHAYVAGSQLSEDSERKIQQGNQQALPPDIYPEALHYVALGHLHLAQSIHRSHPDQGDFDLHPASIRYSGSPIPLSMAELDYPHQVLLLEVNKEGLHSVRSVHVPRFVELIRIPKDPAPLKEVIRQMESALPRESQLSEEAWPLVEARVRLESAEPALRATVEKAMEGIKAHLIKISVERPAPKKEMELRSTELKELAADEIFRAMHRRHRNGTEPKPALLAAFSDLLSMVESEE